MKRLVNVLITKALDKIEDGLVGMACVHEMGMSPAESLMFMAPPSFEAYEAQSAPKMYLSKLRESGTAAEIANPHRL